MNVHHSVSTQGVNAFEGYYPSSCSTFLNPSGLLPHMYTKFLPWLYAIIAVENGHTGAMAALRRLCVRWQRVSFCVYTEFGPFSLFFLPRLSGRTGLICGLLVGDGRLRSSEAQLTCHATVHAIRRCMFGPLQRAYVRLLVCAVIFLGELEENCPLIAGFLFLDLSLSPNQKALGWAFLIHSSCLRHPTCRFVSQKPRPLEKEWIKVSWQEAGQNVETFLLRLEWINFHAFLSLILP